MATNLSGRWYIDGVDLYTTFGMFIEEGSAVFLRYPPKKTSIEHDWQDSNGREVDLSQVFFDQREGTIQVGILGTNRDDYFNKHDQFISHLTQPGLRRLTLSSHGERSYFVYYKECNNYTQVKALTGALEGKYAMRFSIVLVEPEPVVDSSHVFLVDEDGRFLIT